MVMLQDNAQGSSLPLRDDPSLEGTFKAIVRLPKPMALAAGTIILHHQDKHCAALIDAIEGNPEPEILIDGQLKTYLAGSAKSPMATFSFNTLEPARSVELHVTARAVDQPDDEAWIKNRLSARPLSEGLELKLYGLLAGEAHEIAVRVGHIDPAHRNAEPIGVMADGFIHRNPDLSRGAVGGQR